MKTTAVNQAPGEVQFEEDLGIYMDSSNENRYFTLKGRILLSIK